MRHFNRTFKVHLFLFSRYVPVARGPYHLRSSILSHFLGKLLFLFSYITQMTRTTKFVVVRTFGARESVSQPFDRWIPPDCNEKFACPQPQIMKCYVRSEPVRRSLDMGIPEHLIVPHSCSQHIRTPLSYHSFHNKESWGWYARIIPFISFPHRSRTSREHIFSSSVNLKSALFAAVPLRRLLAMCGYLT